MWNIWKANSFRYQRVFHSVSSLPFSVPLTELCTRSISFTLCTVGVKNICHKFQSPILWFLLPEKLFLWSGGEWRQNKESGEAVRSSGIIVWICIGANNCLNALGNNKELSDRTKRVLQSCALIGGEEGNSQSPCWWYKIKVKQKTVCLQIFSH